jgi:predicted RNase H-like nuclease
MLRQIDLLDAICLCLVNKLGSEAGFSYIADINEKDEHQIQIKLAYYRK